VWVARVTGIAVARRPRAYPLTFGPGSVAVVRGRDSDSVRAWRLGSTQVPWNQRLTTMDNPQEAPTGQGSSTPRAGHTVVGAHTEEARTRPVPVRRFHNAAPQRTMRKPNPARSRARACYPGGLQLASTSPTHRNRTLSATSMFITAAVSSRVGAPLALC